MSSDEGLREWLQKIVRFRYSFCLDHYLTAIKYLHGFCFVKGVPVDPESTQTLLERIAFIRHTHYGKTFYLVQNMLSSFCSD